MKNLDGGGGFEVKNYADKWSNLNFFLHKSKEERTEIISRLLFTSVRHKLLKFL